MRSTFFAALVIAAVAGCSAPPGNGLLGGDTPGSEGTTDSTVDGGAPGTPGSPGAPGPTTPGPTSGMDSGAVAAPQDAGAHDSSA
ncbi:MAG: hypothetical protein ABIP39_05075, partial [Polyangiaceae bacterium]